MKFDFERFRQSVLSGIMVGIGIVVNLSAGDKYIGAMLFSLALLTIIQKSLPLYTGRIGLIRKYKVSELAQIFVYNIIGVVIPVFMMIYCKDGFYDTLMGVAQSKFANGFLELFFLGALCGVLMLVAVQAKSMLIAVFCIMVFILSGYEHCVADFPYIVLNFSWVNLGKFLCIVLGNSVGSIVTYELMRCKDE